MTTQDVFRRYAAPMIVTCALAAVPALATAESATRSESSYPHTAREAQNPVNAPTRDETREGMRNESARDSQSGDLNPHSQREAQNPISAPSPDSEASAGTATRQGGVATRGLYPQSDRERQNPLNEDDSATPTMGLGSDEDERRTRQRSTN